MPRAGTGSVGGGRGQLPRQMSAGGWDPDGSELARRTSAPSRARDAQNAPSMLPTKPILTSLPLILLALAPGERSRPGGGQEAASSPAAQGVASVDLEAERSIARHVDRTRARDVVRAFVALGARMGGTASGERSAKLLEATFAEIGLPTTRHVARKTWCHEETGWELSVRIDEEEPYTIERAWPLGFSPAGSGSHPLALESDPERALLTGRFRGTRRKATPPALVLDDGRTSFDGAWPTCGPHPLGRRAKAPGFAISKPEGARLRAALAAGQSVRVDWELETRITEASPVTVVATIAPRSEALPGHVLVCAHGDSDSGGPGANDNASGIAIVLEMARAWKAALEAGELTAPPIEVRFAVWGKEIHSTADYLRSELGKDVVAVLNFDQAGFGSTGQRLHVEPDDLPANAAFVRVCARVLADHAGQPGFPERWATNKSLGGTDSYVFSGNKRFRADELPAVTMFTSAWGSPDEQPRTTGMPGESWRERDRVEMDYDVHYHSAGDTPENTTDKEPENMGWCARVGLISILRWLDVLADAER